VPVRGVRAALHGVEPPGCHCWGRGTLGAEQRRVSADVLRASCVREQQQTMRRSLLWHNGGGPSRSLQRLHFSRKRARFGPTMQSSALLHRHVFLGLLRDPRASVRGASQVNVNLALPTKLGRSWNTKECNDSFRLLRATGTGRRRTGTPRMATGGINLLIQTGPPTRGKQVVFHARGGLRGLTWSARCDPAGQKWPGPQAPVQDDEVDSWDDPKRPAGHGKEVPSTQ